MQCTFVKKDEKVVGADIAYRLPEPIEIALDEVSLQIASSFKTNESRLRTISLEEQVWIGLDGSKSLTIEQIHSQYIVPLQAFMSFATDRPSSIDELVLRQGRGSTASEERSACRFHVLYRPMFYSEATSHVFLSPSEMLFSLSDIRDLLGKALENWLQLSREFSGIMKLLIPCYGVADRYVDERFLRVVQLVALYLAQVRRTGAEYALMFSELDRMAKGLASGDQAGLIGQVVPQMHELAFPGTLLSMLQEHEVVMAPIIKEGFREFVNTILSSRRYLEDCPTTQKPTGASGSDLYWNSERLLVLLKMLLLQDIGIDTQTAQRLVTRNRSYVFLKGR